MHCGSAFEMGNPESDRRRGRSRVMFAHNHEPRGSRCDVHAVYLHLPRRSTTCEARDVPSGRSRAGPWSVFFSTPCVRDSRNAADPILPSVPNAGGCHRRPRPPPRPPREHRREAGPERTARGTCGYAVECERGTRAQHATAVRVFTSREAPIVLGQNLLFATPRRR